MATIAVASPSTSPPPPSSSRSSRRRSNQAKSLPVSRTSSFSSNSTARPSFPCHPYITNNNSSSTCNPSSSSSSFLLGRTAISATTSPRAFGRINLPSTTGTSPSITSPSLSQSDLHSILVATVSAQLARLSTSTTSTPDYSPPSTTTTTRMRSLSHSQAQTMFRQPTSTTGTSSSRPTSAHYINSTLNSSTYTDEMTVSLSSSVPRTAAGGSGSGGASLIPAQDKENINTTTMIGVGTPSGSKTPLRSSSSSSSLHPQPFKYTTQTYHVHSHGSTTPLSTSPGGASASASPSSMSSLAASLPSSPAKHARRRSSVPHPRSPAGAARSSCSRPSSITSESQLGHYQLQQQQHARALQKAVEEAVLSDEEEDNDNDNSDDDADNEAPAKQQRRKKSSNASHTERRMSASAKGSPSSSTTPSKQPSSPREGDLYTQTQGRRSRRNSASSSAGARLVRSRQNSSSATFVSSTSPSRNIGGPSASSSSTSSLSSSKPHTPTSRGTTSFKDALDMHASSQHAQSSSLSSRSDTTLHPADFAFSPPVGTLADTKDEDGDELESPDFDDENHLRSSTGPQSSSLASPSISARASQMFITLIKIRDYAFPIDDPRYRGAALPPTPIDLPSEDEMERYGSWVSPNSLNGQMAHGPGLSQTQTQTQCGPSPSMSLMSSSSSSSLSSGFTPPPFGSFGHGHHYHYAGSGMPRYDASNRLQRQGRASQSQQRDSNGQLSLPPGGSWSTWDQNNLETLSNNEDHHHVMSSTPSAGSTNTAGRMWNFVTEPLNDTPGLPGNLLDSALSIEDFDDDFDDDDDDEDMSYERHSNRGDLMTEDSTAHQQQQQQQEQQAQQQQQQPVGLTEEQKASEESFANLPAGTGIYKVQYTFAAEAPQEMDVNAGDHVRVWQQLCDGWVLGAKVVQKQQRDSNSGSASPDRIEYAELCSGLIPQSYLLFSHTVTLGSGDAGNTAEDDRVIAYYTPSSENRE